MEKKVTVLFIGGQDGSINAYRLREIFENLVAREKGMGENKNFSSFWCNLSPNSVEEAHLANAQKVLLNPDPDHFALAVMDLSSTPPAIAEKIINISGSKDVECILFAQERAEFPITVMGRKVDYSSKATILDEEGIDAFLEKIFRTATKHLK